MESEARSVSRAYDLNGVTLAIAAATEQQAAFLDPILAPLRCQVPPAPDWIASISTTEMIEPPSSGARIFEGPLPEGLFSIMVEDGDERILVVPGHFAMRFRRSIRTVEIDVVPGKEAELGGTAAFWMIDDLLPVHGRHLLHGAMLVDPVTERSIAVFAPSGTGKTTTALALARAGLGLAGDDALVLDASKGGFGLWAIPRKIKVHRRTAALLPWLAPILSDRWSQDEQAFDLQTLSTLIPLASPRQRKVELVIALAPPNDTGHAITAIPKPEALAAVVCDNLRIAPNGVDRDNAAAFAALAGFIAATNVVSLSVGPDPGTLSRALVGLT